MRSFESCKAFTRASAPKKHLYKILMDCNMLDLKARRTTHRLRGEMRIFVSLLICEFGGPCAEASAVCFEHAEHTEHTEHRPLKRAGTALLCPGAS